MKEILFFLIFILSSCDSTPPFATKVGYFKDANKGRAFTFVLPSEYTRDRVKGHAQKQMHSPGKMTTVFYYEANQKAVDPTQLKTSLYEVIKNLNLSDYKYRADKTPDGKITMYEK